jgi:hypothetical protein
MFLQGDLQVVFDALYIIGAIDPVLKLDWETVTQEMVENPQEVHSACTQINACKGDKDLMVQKLSRMDERSVHYVALEVARELCEAQDKKVLH